MDLASWHAYYIKKERATTLSGRTLGAICDEMRMKRYLDLSIILLLSVCSRDQRLASSSTVMSEEYRIYEAVIDTVYMKPGIDQVIVIDSTITQTTVDSTYKIKRNEERDSHYVDRFAFFDTLLHYDLDWSQLGEDFNRNSLKQYLLVADSLKLPAKVVSLTSSYVRQIFDSAGGDGWQRFYRSYPHSRGFIEFSRVGFNLKREQAVVYIEQFIGDMNAGGKFVFLLKRAGKWIPQYVLGTWVS